MAYFVSLVPPHSLEGAPLADEAWRRLAAVLTGREELPSEDGLSFTWHSGQTNIEVRVFLNEKGDLREVDMALPFGAVREEVDEAIERIMSVARDVGLEVFDPQLGRTVGAGGEGSITARFFEVSSYHLEFGGFSEDSRQAMGSAFEHEQPAMFSPRAKMLAVGVGVLIVIYLLLRLVILDPLLESLVPPPPVEPDTSAGPPPGWLDRNPPPSKTVD